MIRRLLSTSAVALGALAFISSKPASAATLIQSGSTVDGWTITFPADVGLSLVNDGANGPVLDIEKIADFSGNYGIPITFTQASYSGAASQIDVVSEALTNQTGGSWGGFQFLLISPMNEGQNFASTFTSYSPFTTSTESGNNNITLGGGTVGNGATADLGPNGGGLVINGDPVGSGLFSDFVLKEIPIPGGSTPPGVPIPASAWTSLFGLAGVVLFATISRRRKPN